MEIGAWMPAIGRMPGSRRPVRTMTLPSISRRRMALGEPTSPLISGVIVAALRPSPGALHGGSGFVDDTVFGLASFGEREIVRFEFEFDADDVGSDDAQSVD